MSRDRRRGRGASAADAEASDDDDESFATQSNDEGDGEEDEEDSLEHVTPAPAVPAPRPSPASTPAATVTPTAPTALNAPPLGARTVRRRSSCLSGDVSRKSSRMPTRDRPEHLGRNFARHLSDEEVERAVAEHDDDAAPGGVVGHTHRLRTRQDLMAMRAERSAAAAQGLDRLHTPRVGGALAEAATARCSRAARPAARPVRRRAARATRTSTRDIYAVNIGKNIGYPTSRPPTEDDATHSRRE